MTNTNVSTVLNDLRTEVKLRVALSLYRDNFKFEILERRLLGSCKVYMGKKGIRVVILQVSPGWLRSPFLPGG